MKLRNNTNKPKALRAIHANPGVSDWYAAAMVDLLQGAINDAVIMITGAWNTAPPTAGLATDSLGGLDHRVVFTPGHMYYPDETHAGQWVDSYWTLAMDAPSSTRKLDAILKKWGDKWSKRFDRLSKQVAARFSKQAFVSTDVSIKAALKNAGFTVSFKPTKRTLESYKLVLAENVGLIRNLQKNLYSKIQEDTWSSVRAGGDMAMLSRKLHKSYGIEARRAARIAIDQNNKAKGVLEAARRQELGLKQAIWQHSSGGKEPRPVHVAWGREGKVFDLNKGLYDPDEGEWILPGQLINCRCTSRAIIPGFDE